MEKVSQKSLPVLVPGVFSGIKFFPESPAWLGEDHKVLFQHVLTQRGSYMKARDAIRELMFISHGASYIRGWWHDSDTGALQDQAYQVPIKLALIHSEISEALEADRKGEMDGHLPDRPGIEVELADALLRIFDLAGALDLDLGRAFIEKAKYNAARADHDVEARTDSNGKAY